MTSWQQAWDYQRTTPVIVRRREDDGSWFEVSKTFAFRWGEQSMACRLLLRRPKPT